VLIRLDLPIGAKPFESFAALCAKSLWRFTGTGDDRNRRNHSQKITKVAKTGARKSV
jgi:hypothetical protein